MTITAQIIADSISPHGIRLTTMQLRYPRFIHAEFMTHRAFSRNASSSRAIPVEKLIADIQRDTAMPEYWGSNKPGMQAGAELTGDDLEFVKAHWLNARDDAIHYAKKLHSRGAHKQIVNRLLEPFSHINVVVTATDYANFYALRRHADAQPEIKVLADAMFEAQEASVPVELVPGAWHLPYVKTGADDEGCETIDTLIKLSVARCCARTSYFTHEGKPPNIEDDLRLYGVWSGILQSMRHHASIRPRRTFVSGTSVRGMSRLPG